MSAESEHPYQLHMRDQLLELLREIAADMERDAKSLDGKPLNGKVVAEAIGNLCTGIQAVALVLEEHIARTCTHGSRGTTA